MSMCQMWGEKPDWYYYKLTPEQKNRYMAHYYIQITEEWKAKEKKEELNIDSLPTQAEVERNNPKRKRRVVQSGKENI